MTRLYRTTIPLNSECMHFNTLYFSVITPDYCSTWSALATTVNPVIRSEDIVMKAAGGTNGEPMYNQQLFLPAADGWWI